MKFFFHLITISSIILLPTWGCNQQPSPLEKRQATQFYSPQAGHTEVTSAHADSPCKVKYTDLARMDDAWDTIWQDCPGSPVATCNYIIHLIKSGDTTRAAEQATKAVEQFPDFPPLVSLARRIHDPLAFAAEVAESSYKDWLNRESDQPFNVSPPKKETPTSLPTLIKGEFEKRSDFETRVARAKADRKRELQNIEARYQDAVQAFNQKVTAHNQRIAAEKQQRMKGRFMARARCYNQAARDVLGPMSLKALQYDAEAEVFHGILNTTSGLFTKEVTISVPLEQDQAKTFKQERNQMAPFMDYTITKEGSLHGGPRVTHRDHTYVITLSDSTFVPVPVTAVADVAPPEPGQISPIKMVTNDISIEEKYYQEALAVQDDPELAKLRQEKAENQRKLREARAAERREQERDKIQAEIRLQQEKLANMGGTAGEDYKGLTEKYHWQFPRTKTPATNMVAVVIGNRNYGNDIPKVYYAYNDARAMTQFLETGMGVPPENILTREDATKGEMEGILLKTLPKRITKGQTDVLVYFSGHGMPHPRTGEALLLPSDTTPEYADINGYSRDKLLTHLASLGARSTTVILDACFSGTSKDAAPLVAGKPVFARVAPAAIPPGMVFISATNAGQIARMDDDKGMSLMTFYLLQGVAGTTGRSTTKADVNGDHQISLGEIKSYLATQVNRSARMAFSADQTPEVVGPENHIFVRY